MLLAGLSYVLCLEKKEVRPEEAAEKRIPYGETGHLPVKWLGITGDII
jgi:hypothetical protein